MAVGPVSCRSRWGPRRAMARSQLLRDGSQNCKLWAAPHRRSKSTTHRHQCPVTTASQVSNQHTPSTSDRTPLKKGLKNLRPTSPRRRPHMYVFLLLNFGRDLDPGPNTRGTLAHTRASVRQTLATLSKHLRCSRLNTWPKLCYQPRS